MQEYDFHIHGKPYSHDIWKNDHGPYDDYLNRMYSNAYLNASTDESYMIIEIHNKTVHYTYMRSKGIRDNAERESSFFAITVSLKEQYCSVIVLYNLLDQIYEKLAKPSLFVQSEIPECLKYKVLRLEDANVADQMLAAFDNNVACLNLRAINNPIDTLRSNETRIVSLRDVDSPEFLEILLRSRIVVSPVLSSAIKRCTAIESELATVKTQRQALSSLSEQRLSEIETLTKENNLLSNQLHASASSTEKKYKSEIDKLQKKLINITAERDTLKQKIQDATSSIELIDQPFQKLTRLLAGRFPENRSQGRNNHLEDKQKTNTKAQNPVWSNWLNSILLGIVLVICWVILAIVLTISTPSNTTDVNANNEKDGEVELHEEETVPDHNFLVDFYEKSRIDIKGGGDTLDTNKDYTLSVKKDNVDVLNPYGYWSVHICTKNGNEYKNEGEKINNEDSFKITDQSKGKYLSIDYIVDGKIVKSRVCEIRK